MVAPALKTRVLISSIHTYLNTTNNNKWYTHNIIVGFHIPKFSCFGPFNVTSKNIHEFVQYIYAYRTHININKYKRLYHSYRQQTHTQNARPESGVVKNIDLQFTPRPNQGTKAMGQRHDVVYFHRLHN